MRRKQPQLLQLAFCDTFHVCRYLYIRIRYTYFSHKFFAMRDEWKTPGIAGFRQVAKGRPTLIGSGT